MEQFNDLSGTGHPLPPPQVPDYKTPQFVPPPRRNLPKIIQLTIPLLVMTVLGYTALVVGQQYIARRTSTDSQAAVATIQTVESAIGGDIIYNDNQNPPNINQVSPGVFELKGPAAYPCTPGTANCEPDKYEIRFPVQKAPIYGLGNLFGGNQVEVDDLLDTAFSMGHVYTPMPGTPAGNSSLNIYNADVGRMKTPILVIPQDNLIIAYLQPWVKMVRVTRNGEYGCPLGQTCIVMKKHSTYVEGEPRELILIKGSSMADAYSKFYAYRKTATLNGAPRFAFKQPVFRNFGVNWETMEEFGCSATRTDIENTVNNYISQNIPLASVTIGSGYWSGGSTSGCGIANSTPGLFYPATDTLVTNPTRYPKNNPASRSGLQELFDWLGTQQIYPLIGMRHSVELGPPIPAMAQTEGWNTDRVQNQYYNALKGVQNPYFPVAAPTPPVFTMDMDNHCVKLLNTFDPNIVKHWISFIHNGNGGTDPYLSGPAGYGGFRGYKEDDMLMGCQKCVMPQNTCVKADQPNVPDNYTSQAYPYHYTASVHDFNGNGRPDDFIIHARNDWFSQGSDATVLEGFLAVRGALANRAQTPYTQKYYLDSALTLTASGYPFPRSHFNDPDFDLVNGMIAEANRKKFLRREQLATYFSVTNITRGYWHLPDSGVSATYRKGIIATYQLRHRLRQYAYDKARDWYETGVPTLMQPLFIRWRPAADANHPTRKMYDVLADANYQHDEFMFGNALLVRPVLSDTDTLNVYVPGLAAGESGAVPKWRPFFKAQTAAWGGGK